MIRDSVDAKNPCDIFAVGKRRDGGTRYWCVRHRADATAKYGKRATQCRYAHIPVIRRSETLTIELDEYSGGVGVWGAVPPVYDTTTQPIDRGIHVHARKAARGEKCIDKTYRRVRVAQRDAHIAIDELDAIYFMVSLVFGLEPEEVICTHCRASHLDKDWFSVHPHRSHLCASCGKHFRDDRIAVGNPAAAAASLMEQRPAPQPARKTLTIRQKDYPGGLRIWGSNEAILWTATRPELTGIHVHAYKAQNRMPHVDETFAAVTIDDVDLDPEAVRTYMAQMALPHLAGRVVAGWCRDCGTMSFDRGEDAFRPTIERACKECGGTLDVEGRFRKVVTNPLVGLLRILARHAVRPPRKHDLGLLPETL